MNAVTPTEPATHATIAIGNKEKKLEFSVPIRYQAGHVVTENEAKALNQVMRENIGNNFRNRIQAHLEGLPESMTEAALREAFDKYVAEYEFAAHVAGAGTKTLTPIERECRKIATAIVKANLAKAGRSVETKKKPATEDGKVVSQTAFEGEVERISTIEQVVKLAKKNVKDMENIAALVTDVAA